MIDRDKFFAAVRDDPFGGNLTQGQVNGMNGLLDTWEKYFADAHPSDGAMFLSYALATAFHETDRKMEAIEEYGEGSGYDYGRPTGPYGQCYYGRGHVMLTWESNYIRGEEILRDKFGLECPMHMYPHRMLEHEPSSIVLFDGSITGWFTGVSLPKFFNSAKGIEDPYNARKVINGLDRAADIEKYYWSFKKALT